MNTEMDVRLDRIRDRIDRLEGSAETAEAKAHQLESRLKSAEHAGRLHFRVAQCLAEVRHASGDSWRERKESVAAARAELERRADAALKQFNEA